MSSHESICIICLGENEISETNPLTKEHVVPEFIGGGLYERFVCKICNSTMGNSFEGELSKSALFKNFRYINSISGKSKQDHPFCGIHKDKSSNKKFEIDRGGNVSIYNDFHVSILEEGINVKGNFSVSNRDREIVALRKKIERVCKKKQLSISVSEIIKGFEKKLDCSPHERIRYDLDISISNPEGFGKNFVFLALKIGYELACFNFRQDYIHTDSIASLLRMSLKSSSIPDDIDLHVIHNQYLKSIFSLDSHWVIFYLNLCVVKISPIPGYIVFRFSDGKNKLNNNCFPKIYRFDFKNRTYKILTRAEIINLYFPC